MTERTEISAIYQTETPNAVCVREVEDGPDVWLPKSEIEVEPDIPSLPLERGAVVTVTGPEWLLEDRGLI